MPGDITSAMRWFIAWENCQRWTFEQAVTSPFASSQFNQGDPEGKQCAAERLMDLLTSDERKLVADDDTYEPFGLTGALDKMAHTQFLFNDGSALEFDKQDQWWRVSGEHTMLESHEYAYNANTGSIEARDHKLADEPWPPPNGRVDEDE